MMINVLHLLWIIPLAFYIGMFAMGLLFASKDHEAYDNDKSDES